MRLSDALARAAGAVEESGGTFWVAVGPVAHRALRRALDGVPHRIRRVDDVHHALEVLEDGRYDGCVVDGRRLDDRPSAALELLRLRVGAKRVLVLDRDASPGLRRVAKRCGVVLCRAASGDKPPPARTLPRADESPAATAAPTPGRFAAGCLERQGDKDALLTYLFETLTAIAGASRVSVMLVDQPRRALRIQRAVGLDDSLVGTLRCPLGQGIAGRAADVGRPVTGRGAAGGERSYPGRAYIVLPLGTAQHCEGVANLTGFAADRLPAADQIQRWIRIARLAGRALETTRRLERAESLMATDPLTALPNRRAFEDALAREVERASRAGTGLAVALFDVDHFKRVNDDHGHPAGDRVLVRVGQLLKSAFRESDLVARWGGEEFAALLPALEPRQPETALKALERARKRIAQRPFPLGPGRPPQPVTASCGVAFLPTDGSDPAALVEAADRALYEAKDAGRNTVRRAR